MDLILKETYKNTEYEKYINRDQKYLEEIYLLTIELDNYTYEETISRIKTKFNSYNNSSLMMILEL